MGLRPYGNYLFFSVAEKFASETIAIILTGMGRDGADGMKKLHDMGALTIGQDEDSCVVYGMPKEALELGAVDSQLHLNDIAGYLNKIVHKG
jgi:two-component system chemotaxis response regulator CheB